MLNIKKASILPSPLSDNLVQLNSVAVGYSNRGETFVFAKKYNTPHDITLCCVLSKRPSVSYVLVVLPEMFVLLSFNFSKVHICLNEFKVYKFNPSFSCIFRLGV